MIDSFIALPFNVYNEDPAHTIQSVLWKSPSSDQAVFFQVNAEIASETTTRAKSLHEPCQTGRAYAALLF